MFPQVPQFLNPMGAVKRVGSYVGNVAQNVRDVGTALGTNVQIARNESVTKNSPLNIAGSKNVVQQAKEVAGAVLGNPGTRSDQYKPSVGYMPQGVQPTKAKVAAPTTTVSKPAPKATAPKQTLKTPRSVPNVEPKNTPNPQVEVPAPVNRPVE